MSLHRHLTPKEKPKASQVAYLGLGTNVGDRILALNAAVTALGGCCTVLQRSAIYETAPQGEILDQPDFLNAVCKVETVLDPEDLLDQCKQIEVDAGRMAAPRHSPRPLDIDILLHGELAYESTRLNLPHRDLTNRRFVVDPLLELDPDLRLPNGDLLRDVTGDLCDQRVIVLAVPGWPGAS